jgi:hypothetical protein
VILDIIMDAYIVDETYISEEEYSGESEMEFDTMHYQE